MDPTLRGKLEELHAELEKTECVDDPDCEILRDVMEHIQTILDQSEPVPAHRYISLGARLGQAVKQFEVSHPDTVLAIGRLLDHFANV